MDPYDVLGVARDAGHEELEAAYRRLVRRHHPDRHVGASAAERAEHERRMAEVTGAWRLVNDPVALARHRAARARSVRPDGQASASTQRPGRDPDAPFDYRSAAASEFTTSDDSPYRSSPPPPPRPVARRRGGRGRPAWPWWLLLAAVVAVVAWLLTTATGAALLGGPGEHVATLAVVAAPHGRAAPRRIDPGGTR